MKPAKFDYYDPRSLEEALTLLDTHQGDGKVLAGGQSLMPLLNMRLARPNVVVDINRIKELNYVRPSDGGIAVGALARQRALQTDKVIAERVPILQEAAYYIAHPQIRSRGTICGSIAHADPAAELPALALALDAEMTLTSAKAARTVGAEAFFQSFFELTCTQYFYVILEMHVLIKKLLNYHFLLAAVQCYHMHFVHNDCKLSIINLCCLIYN